MRNVLHNKIREDIGYSLHVIIMEQVTLEVRVAASICPWERVSTIVFDHVRPLVYAQLRDNVLK